MMIDIKLNASDLKALFSSFMKEKYGYVPLFNVGIYALYALPVTIEFDEHGEAFDRFYSQFEYDMYSIPEKDWHMGDEYDYGDKLLELIYLHPMMHYDIIGADMGHDVYFAEGNEEGSILVSYDTSKPTQFLTKQEIERQLAYDDE